jgi:hypothetical protein
MESSTNPADFAVVGSAVFLILLGTVLLLSSLVKDARTEQTHCHVHGTELQLDLVPIVYGLPAFGEEYWEMQERLPSAQAHVLGGCTVQLEKLALVRYCPVCRVGLRAWEAGQARAAATP